MSARGYHLEEWNEDIQGVSDREQDEVGVPLLIEWESVRKMTLVDPAPVLDDSFSLEARVLQLNA